MDGRVKGRYPDLIELKPNIEFPFFLGWLCFLGVCVFSCVLCAWRVGWVFLLFFLVAVSSWLVSGNQSN